MNLDLKIGENEIRVVTDKDGFPIGIEVNGMGKEEEIPRMISGEFFQRLKEFTQEEKPLEAIVKAYLTTSTVSYEINWKFRDILRCAVVKLEDGFFDYGKEKREIQKAIEEKIKEQEKIQKQSALPRYKLDQIKFPKDKEKLIEQSKKVEKQLKFFDYEFNESDFDYFKRMIGGLRTTKHINGLSENAMECYNVSKR